MIKRAIVSLLWSVFCDRIAGVILLVFALPFVLLCGVTAVSKVATGIND